MWLLFGLHQQTEAAVLLAVLGATDWVDGYLARHLHQVSTVGKVLVEPNAGQSLNLISMIGIVMLFGLVAKNGILLVDYSNTLCRRGMRVHDAVLQAAGTRFRPILMTTCAMIFGMLPLSLGFAEGGEWRQAMGTVIIGGLLSSLILTLFLVPMVYETWMGFFERHADQRAIAAEMSPTETAGARG